MFFSFPLLHGVLLWNHVPWADINECEQVPKPCAYQCANIPGSFKCICPPGQHLLGDGKSCAGLERFPNYGTYYNSYNYAQFSPMRDNYRPQQYIRHSSNLYSSYSEYRNSRIPISRTRRNVREPCPEGYEARNNKCIGKCHTCICVYMYVYVCTYDAYSFFFFFLFLLLIPLRICQQRQVVCHC